MEPHDLAGDLVYAPRDLDAAPEPLHLHLVDVVLQPLDDRGVPLDDQAHDLVEHGLWASPEPVGLALHPPARFVQRSVLSVAHRDDKALSYKRVYLPELDLLRVLQVTRRLEHGEEAIPVAFELGTLVILERIVDRQLVQLELFGNRDELSVCGLVEGDPGEPVRTAAGTVGFS